MEKQTSQSNDVGVNFKFLIDDDHFNLKQWIIEYFDYVVNKIDLETELLFYNDCILRTNQNKVDQINKLRDDYIVLIQNMQAYNLKQYEINKTDLNSRLDRYLLIKNINKNTSTTNNNNQEEIMEKRLNDLKRSLFKEFCIFVDKDIIDFLFKKEKEEGFLLGALIVTDSYLDENFVEYLKDIVKDKLESIDPNYYYNENDSENFMDKVLDKNLFYYTIFSSKLKTSPPSFQIIRIDSKYISSLTTLEIKEDLKSISNNVFEKLKLNNLKILDLSSNKIDTPIKKCMFNGLASLDELNLSSNHIDIIETNAFQHLNNLTNLNLGSNKIEYLKNDTFNNLDKLKELNLFNNRIKSIEGSLFKKLKSLVKLNLSTNKFDLVAGDSFKGLNNLEFLYLCKDLSKSSHSNRIKSIDKDSFNDLIDLKELYLNNQILEKLEIDTFKNLVNLKSLSLKSIDATLFDKQCFNKLESLNKLVLYGGSGSYLSEPILIRKMPFKNLKNLTELNMSDYSIKSMEDDAFIYLVNLMILKLSNNNLCSIRRDHLKNLKHLKTLDLSYNKLVHLDEFTFSSLSNLEELILKSNKIETIYFNTFSGLVNLKTLNLCENPVCTLQSGSFNCLENLIRLDLSKTNIMKLNKYDFFEKLTKLEELYLKSLNMSNKARPECTINVEKNTFENLEKLKVLNLQENSIKYINKDLLNGLNNLIELNISHNQVESIEPDSFAHMMLLKELFLNNNRIYTINISNDGISHNLEVLDLGDNHIHYEQVDDINRYAVLTNLKSLNLTNNRINVENASEILKTLLPNLIDLNLSNNDNNDI